MNRLLLPLFATVVMVLACGADEPIEAEGPIQSGPYPVGEVSAEVTNPDGSITAYTVSCLGDTATLVGDWDISGDGLGGTAADAMCTRLADSEVADVLINGVPDFEICTDQYGSEHVARITGTLDGADVDVRIDRIDGCGIDLWDRVLLDVLPTIED